MLSDLKYALRQCAKNPGFTAAVVLILALGIGANTAIFTVINAVMLRTLPVPDPARLVFLTDPNFHGVNVGGGPDVRDALTYPEFQHLRDHNTVFTGLLAAAAQTPRLDATIEGGGEPASGGRVLVSMVSGNYFGVLGVKPIVGAAFTSEVDEPRDAHPVAVISYAYWQTQFGGDPGVLTRRIRLNKTSFSILGVAPAGFAGETLGTTPAVWVPLSMQPEIRLGQDFLSAEQHPTHKTFWLQAIGRLKPGLGIAQAQAGIETTFRQYLEGQLPELLANDRTPFLEQHISLTDGRHGGSSIRQTFDAPLLFLMVLVALLLLIACANVANLLLARATFRRKELGIRVALGASPARIVRQLLVESAALSLLGGAAGLLVAHWGDVLLLRMVGSALDVVHLQLDLPILAFTLGTSLAVGILFGVTPALSAARVDLASVLKGLGTATRPGRISLGKGLVVAQIALSLLLLIVAGLFVRSFQKLSQVPLGFDRDHILAFDAPVTALGIKGAEIRQLYEGLSERLRVTPGVRGVTYSMLGLLGGGDTNLALAIDGLEESGREMSAHEDHVGPNYFGTIGIPVLLGRDIGPQDQGSGQRVAVINRTMAEYYFGEANPIGRRITLPNSTGAPPVALIIVGMVADAKYHAAKEKPMRRFYVPFFNTGGTDDAVFEIRTSSDPVAVADAIRASVKRAYPAFPTVGIRIMSQVAERQLNGDLLLAKLSGFFSTLAAVLACTGIYGLMSYSVARRTREVGIRMALGARRGDVLRLILRETCLLALIGIAVGIPVAIGAGKLLGSLVYGLGFADGTVLAAAALLMLGAAAAAGYLPARRATKVDPMVALRVE